MNPVWFGQSFCFLISLLLAGAIFAPAGAAQTPVVTDDASNSAAKPKEGASQVAEAKAEKKSWKPLTGSWVVSQFGGDGPTEITDKLIKLGFGDPLTGVRWEGELLRENYEIELEARRTEGFDFFCALTFPVGENHVSLILGGWGGGVVGISSVDGRDASENDTTSFRNFDNEQWYKVRVSVDPNEIRCWIDDKLACSQVREGHKFGIRYEMDQCVPLGLAAFQCKSELRGMQVRKLSDEELADAKKVFEEQNP